MFAFPAFRPTTTIWLGAIISVHPGASANLVTRNYWSALAVFANSCCTLFAASCHEQADILERTYNPGILIILRLPALSISQSIHKFVPEVRALGARTSQPRVKVDSSQTRLDAANRLTKNERINSVILQTKTKRQVSYSMPTSVPQCVLVTGDESAHLYA